MKRAPRTIAPGIERLPDDDVGVFLQVRMSKGDRRTLKNHCCATNVTMAAFVVAAVREKIAREGDPR